MGIKWTLNPYPPPSLGFPRQRQAAEEKEEMQRQQYGNRLTASLQAFKQQMQNQPVLLISSCRGMAKLPALESASAELKELQSQISTWSLHNKNPEVSGAYEFPLL